MKNVLIAATVGAVAGFTACKFGPKIVEFGKQKVSVLRERFQAAHQGK